MVGHLTPALVGLPLTSFLTLCLMWVFGVRQDGSHFHWRSIFDKVGHILSDASLNFLIYMDISQSDQCIQPFYVLQSASVAKEVDRQEGIE